MPRIGRPKAEEPKSVNYSIRIDIKTEEKLKEYCDKNGIKRGEAIRRGIHMLLDEKK